MGNGVKKRKKATQALRALHPRATQSIYPQLRTMDPQSKKNIVIVGGGIIGSTTAYFLSRHPKFNPALHKITLLEATSIAAGASGKAGGLLALWAYPQPLVPLSYRLHAELAAEHGGAERWGYRRVGCGSFDATVTRAKLDAVEQASAARAAAVPGANDGEEQKGWERLPKQDDAAEALLKDSVVPKDLDWVDHEIIDSYQEMGHPGATETAQVHPFHFTTSMAALAAEKGVDIRTRAKLTKINSSPTGVESVERHRHRRPNVEGLRAHSVVYDATVSPYAVFTRVLLPEDYVPAHRVVKGQRRKHKRVVDPEIYARPFGEVYACGEPDRTDPLPDTADLVRVDEANCDDLLAYIATFSPQLAAARVKAKQACYLPQREGGPLIGATSTPGLWVAAGHTCWGIQNGPATGKLMAEYVMDGKTSSSDISEMDPRRYSRV
ncbi:oxidoreductase [Verticillium dahliae VdLs.17]|uniref:Oxidoreductase n=1 Tax=Verticillium dahliae (strain VdLs.17 / ATCC MYA-4575 / FGSC 10137) TaxID=498257 RepID=G2XEB5_VERDV|nr:oxidoreductase [Verticillium dahliae VdLs.17]EGY18163.1 oxidoreductase [Verticillium dahliae VdLs.17]